MKKLSIIVPVYNIERYIEKCILSMVDNIKNNDYEILLIDDGSTDKSSDICKHFSDTYDCISYYEKENGGLSDARNYGIKKATGSFLMFVDGDDYICGDKLNELIEYVVNRKETDVFLINGYKIEGNKRVELKHYDIKGALSGEAYLQNYYINQYIRVEAWLTVCSRQFIIDKNLFFKKGRLHEDVLWFVQTMLEAKKVINSNIFLYNYVIREGSISTQKDRTMNFKHLRLTCKELESYLPKLDSLTRKSLQELIVNYFLNSILLINYDSLCKVDFDKKFLSGKPKRFKTRLKVLIYFISPAWFWKVFN